VVPYAPPDDGQRVHPPVPFVELPKYPFAQRYSVRVLFVPSQLHVVTVRFSYPVLWAPHAPVLPLQLLHF